MVTDQPDDERNRNERSGLIEVQLLSCVASQRSRFPFAYIQAVSPIRIRRPTARWAEIAAAETESVRSDVVDMQPGAWLIDRM